MGAGVATSPHCPKTFSSLGRAWFLSRALVAIRADAPMVPVRSSGKISFAGRPGFPTSVGVAPDKLPDGSSRSFLRFFPWALAEASFGFALFRNAFARRAPALPGASIRLAPRPLEARASCLRFAPGFGALPLLPGLPSFRKGSRSGTGLVTLVKPPPASGWTVSATG
jgi:hypothetical protein